MGISPRLSDNYVLNPANANMRGEFIALSHNRDQFGRNYLKSYAAVTNPSETHYRAYIEMIEQLYPGKQIEEVAAFTDLYHCAYPAKPPYYDADYQPLPADSPCATKFFEKTIEKVKPLAVITRGEPQTRVFKKYYVTASKVSYNTRYDIVINGFETSLLPLRWQMDTQWAMKMIRTLDAEI
jgi:hypothetical protein